MAAVWDRRFLIERFAARELRARYLGTMLGSLWSLIVPLATVAIYSVVFSIIFRAEPPPLGNGEPGIYALWFFTGLTAWSFFTNSVSRSIGNLVGAGRMMQKIYIPPYVPVSGTLLAVSVQLAVEVSIILVILLLLGSVGWAWLLVPAWFVIMAIFVGSVAIIASIANIYVRDVAVVIPVVFQLFFFVTPIIYPLSRVPEYVNGIPLQALVAANPMTEFIQILRSITYGATAPELSQVAIAVAWTLVMVLLAGLVYRRWGRGIAERV